jgi:hypothetical protein
MGLRGPPPGRPKTPGSGRKKGSVNKIRPPNIKAKIAEMQQAALARVEETVAKQTPLEFALQCMHDDSFPPGFRLEACKVAMPYVHAKMAEQSNDKITQVTEIRRIIVSPREVDVDENGNTTVTNEGRYANGDRVEPGDPAEYKAAADLARANRDAPPETDPLTLARSRLDRMRGIH